MHGLNQIQSHNYEVVRQARAVYKARLLAEGKTTICKLDVLGQVDIDVLPLAFDTPEAARGHLNLHIPVHLQKDYLISNPTTA
jgi:hypothetical protein